MECELMNKKPQVYERVKSNFNGITDDNTHQVIVTKVD